MNLSSMDWMTNPTSCIIDADRQIVEKFGIDKCKELDWELINKQVYYS